MFKLLDKVKAQHILRYAGLYFLTLKVDAEGFEPSLLTPMFTEFILANAFTANRITDHF